MPVKLGLGGDQSLDIFADGYPKTQSVDCDSIDPVSPNPLKVVSCQASDLQASLGTRKERVRILPASQASPIYISNPIYFSSNR
jgi:hypothetical protein